MKKEFKKKKTPYKSTNGQQNPQFLPYLFTTLFSAVGEEPHTKSMVSHDHLLSFKGCDINCIELFCSSTDNCVTRLTIKGQEGAIAQEEDADVVQDERAASLKPYNVMAS